MKIERTYRVCHPLISFGVDVELSPKRSGIDLPLGALVNYRAVIAVDRCAIHVGLNKILLDLGTDQFKEIAQPADNGKVPLDRLSRLYNVADAHVNKRTDQNEAKQCVDPEI